MKAQRLGSRRRSPVRTLGGITVKFAIVAVFLLVAATAAAGGLALTTYGRYAAQYVEPSELSLNCTSKRA